MISNDIKFTAYRTVVNGEVYHFIRRLIMTAKRFEKGNRDKEVVYLLLEEGYYPEAFFAPQCL